MNITVPTAVVFICSRPFATPETRSSAFEDAVRRQYFRPSFSNAFSAESERNLNLIRQTWFGVWDTRRFYSTRLTTPAIYTSAILSALGINSMFGIGLIRTGGSAKGSSFAPSGITYPLSLQLSMSNRRTALLSGV